MAASEVSTGSSQRGGGGAGFEAFFAEAEPRLRRALVAAYGSERGREAASEALAWAWEHWDQVEPMANPIGFLYRVGQSRSRQPMAAFTIRWTGDREPEFEPGLAPGLAQLTERQRVAVVLIHGFGWTFREVAELTGTSITTVQTHLDRGLASLRRTLGVHDA